MSEKTFGVLVIAMALATSAFAVTKIVQMPPDGEQLKASPLPGYAKAQANCVACHSARPGITLRWVPKASTSGWNSGRAEA